jgi:hypothetical protein
VFSFIIVVHVSISDVEAKGVCVFQKDDKALTYVYIKTVRDTNYLSWDNICHLNMSKV